MNNRSAISAYQQSTARGASPVGLVVSLYDTILRDFRRALAALDAGNIETRIFELNHSLTVIAHLQSVLDRERGGEAAARLGRFYEVTHAMVLDASVSGSRASLLKLIDLFTPVRQAWQQAELQLSQNPPTNPEQVPMVSVPNIPLPKNSSSDPAPPPDSRRVRWNA
jgi:flagellar protein FliS